MNGIPRQNVAIILTDLEDSQDYQRLVLGSHERAPNQFRQDLETARRICFEEGRTIEDIRSWLERLHQQSLGTLQTFRAAIERAQAELTS